jgi:hypothetical protein
LIWKEVKIIPFRKLNRQDYTIPDAYRPISLLSTLGKALEAVIATRLAFYVEEHDLLPTTHFGARRRRNAEHALMTLVERIHYAWRKQRVVSLLSFDVKGAYNGVVPEVLLRRLRKHGIPEELIQWIGDFCRDRTATIVVNGYTTIPTKLPDVGLPQGSPLSPILYILYNADLVDKKIDYRGGAIAFVDDYSAWVTGPDVETNTAVIQAQLIPRAEEWAKESGATFQAEKTSFIHFTRSAVKSKQTTVRVGMETITSSNSIKLLGVVLDAKLLFHEHVAKVAQRGHRAALALRRLRDMRPMTARQIFEATVTPMVDYASNVWATNLSAKDMRLLSQS